MSDANTARGRRNLGPETVENPRRPSGSPEGFNLSNLARNGGDIPLNPQTASGNAEEGTSGS